MLGFLFILLFIYRQSIARDYQVQRHSDLKMYFAVLKGYWNLPNPFSLKQFIHKLASSATANGRHPPGIRMTHLHVAADRRLLIATSSLAEYKKVWPSVWPSIPWLRAA